MENPQRAAIAPTGTSPAGGVQQLSAAAFQDTRYEERFWVLSGSMTVWAGPEKAVLHSGDFFTVPRRTPHAVHSEPEGSRALMISS
ncbi:cupin domain-containing protein, partial [Actinomadura adrarensis]